jgi:Spy/CpxP family protein refolding chaperone
MLKISLITLAVLGLIAAAGLAWARHNGYCTGGGHFEHVKARVARKLDLNETQSRQLDDFAEALRRLRGEWVERRAAIGDEVERLMAAPTLDREQVMALLEERHQAFAEHKREIVDAFADFSDSLQHEQRTRLVELIAERMQHRWGPRHWAY